MAGPADEPAPQALTLSAADGTRLNLGYYRGLSPKARVLVIAPGFGQHGGTRTMRYIAGLLTPTADILLLDFRGTGGSQGRYQFGAEEAQDLQAALAWAQARYGVTDVMGLSLGGYIALRAAAEGPLRPQHLLLVSPPPRLESVVSSLGFLAHPFDLLWNRHRQVQHGSVDPFFRWGALFAAKPSAIDLAPKLGCASHFLVGGNDFLVFMRLTKKIYEQAPLPKTCTVWPQGGHAEHMALEDPDAFIVWVRRSLMGPLFTGSRDL